MARGDQTSGAATLEASQEALERARILRPILELERRGDHIGAALAAAAQEIGVGRSQAWRLLRQLKANDGRASAIEPRRPGPRGGSRRLAGEVERVMNLVLRERYLAPEPPSFRRIVDEIRAECVARGYRAPTRRTVKARLDALDQREVVRSREGARAARERFEPAPGAFLVARPLQVVQIDHTQFGLNNDQASDLA